MPCITITVEAPTQISIVEVGKGLPSPIYVGSQGTVRSVVVTISSNKATSVNLRLTAALDGTAIHDKTYTVNISAGTNDYFIDNINIPGRSGTLRICAYIGTASKCKDIQIVLTKPDVRVTDLKVLYKGVETTTVPPNEVFVVRAVFTNYGDEGTCWYNLTVNGTEITRQQITLGKGETKTVDMQTRISSEGRYEVCVNTMC